MSLKKRKYLETYLKFGFTFTINNGLDIPVGVLCQKSLGNDSIKPSLLIRYLERAHPEFKDKELDFFKHRESVFKKQCLDKGGMFFQQANALLKAFYEVSLMIAKQKKSHTIGENLVLPAAKVMVRCVFEDESVKKLNSISLSNNTVQRRIKEISVNILQQVISDICRSESGFAIQLDESTDVTNCAQLLIFVRYKGKEALKKSS